MLSVFARELPRRPYCTDDPATGLVIRDRMSAITRPYVQPNHPWRTRWLVFDVDRETATYDWQDRRLAAPNIVCTSRESGHAHLLYGLAFPIHKDPRRFGKALRFGAAVENAYRDALGADFGYTGLLCQNPLHPRWIVTTWQDALYDLDWLTDFPDIILGDGRQRLPPYGLGRNCTLFEDLRLWAYPAIRRLGWPDLDAWVGVVAERAAQRNAMFPRPLPHREVRATARSVARWTHSRFDAASFSLCQQRRAQIGAGRRRCWMLLRMSVAVAFWNYSSRWVEAATGIPAGTVRRLRAGCSRAISRHSAMGGGLEPTWKH